MERYILIANRLGGMERDAIIINNGTYTDALNRAYNFFGGKVSNELFQQALKDMDENNAIELFQLFTGYTIMYFGTEKYGYVYNITELDGENMNG